MSRAVFRAVRCAIALGVVAALVASCASPTSTTSAGEIRDANRVTFSDGESFDTETVVGFRVDPGRAWVLFDGGPSTYFSALRNDELGCEVVLVLSTPNADIQHDLPDEPGSMRLVERFGPTGGATGVYAFPLVDGGTVDMAVAAVDNETVSRVVLAREFSQVKRAIVIDLTCGDSADAYEVLGDLDVLVSVATG
jgi:hypothetical protein